MTKYEEIEKLKTENKNLRMELQEIKEIPELQTAFQFHTQTSNRPPSSSTVSSKKMYKRPVSLSRLQEEKRSEMADSHVPYSADSEFAFSPREKRFGDPDDLIQSNVNDSDVVLPNIQTSPKMEIDNKHYKVNKFKTPIRTEESNENAKYMTGKTIINIEDYQNKEEMINLSHLSINEITKRLESQRPDELAQAAEEMKQNMAKSGRCPICTLQPPCNHYKTQDAVTSAILQIQKLKLQDKEKEREPDREKEHKDIRKPPVSPGKHHSPSEKKLLFSGQSSQNSSMFDFSPHYAKPPLQTNKTFITSPTFSQHPTPQLANITNTNTDYHNTSLPEVNPNSRQLVPFPPTTTNNK